MDFRKAPTELAQIQSCCTAPAGGNLLPMETLTHHQNKGDTEIWLSTQ